MVHSATGLPFDDIRALVRSLPEGNDSMAAHTSAQMGEQNDPVTGFCRWYSKWSGRSPVIHKPLVTLFAGTHLIDQKISGKQTDAWLLDEVTAIAQGNSVTNRLCQLHDAGLKLFDLALQLPVADISEEEALDEKACAGTIAFGMEAIAGGADLLGVGAIEKGLSVSAIILLCKLNRLSLESLEGILEPDQLALAHTVMNRMESVSGDGLELLRHLGGRETAALCGAILAARSQHIPVVIDGITALAACAVLLDIDSQAIGHCILAQGFENDVIHEAANRMDLQLLHGMQVTNNSGAGVVMGLAFGRSAGEHFPRGE